jgi:hypothetical protein
MPERKRFALDSSIVIWRFNAGRRGGGWTVCAAERHVLLGIVSVPWFSMLPNSVRQECGFQETGDGEALSRYSPMSSAHSCGCFCMNSRMS